MIEKDLNFFYSIANTLVRDYSGNEYKNLSTKKKNELFMAGYNTAFKYYQENMTGKNEKQVKGGEKQKQAEIKQKNENQALPNKTEEDQVAYNQTENDGKRKKMKCILQ